MSNLESIFFSSPPILHKIQGLVFSIPKFLVRSLTNKNCHNSRTSNDIKMKLGPLSKLDEGNAMT